ncbi:RidA family protein [Stenotrophobium rhamnosiphilum]|nr:RidA family protein [Stenotrophobium rhamnosiphilum]
MIQYIGKPMVLANGSTVPLTPAVRAGDFVFASGQLGLDDKGVLVADDITAQTRQAIERIRTILGQAGVGLDAIVKVSVWITDKADFAAFNNTYREYFPNNPPARSTVVSDLLIPGAKVEIEATAYAGASQK